MTVSNSTTSVSQQGNGVTTVWPYSFYIADGTQVVTITDLTTGTEGTALDPSLYSITGLGDENGGTVTYPLSGAPLSASYKINIFSNVPIEQTLDLTTQSAYNPEQLEIQLDKMTRVSAKHQEELSRAIKVGKGIANDIDPSEIAAQVTQSAGYAAAAAASEGVASASATAAALSETNAAASETAAGTAATTATTKAAEAVTTKGQIDTIKSQIDTIKGQVDTAKAAADADVVLTHADVVLTHADVVLTHADAAQTASDRTAAAASAASALADKNTVAADKATVAGYRTDIEADRTEVANNLTTITGYKDTVVADAAAVAADKATVAADKTAAATSATNAATSETNAAGSASAAAASAASAAALFDSFDDKYLGAKAANPTTDNDGDPLQDGALYWNTTTKQWNAYDLGSTTWIALATGGAAGIISFTPAGNLSATNVQGALEELDTEKLATTAVHAAAAKASVADGDEFSIQDSAASFALKRITFTTLAAQLWAKLGALIAGGTAKATPVGADTVPLSDSAASNATKKLTITDLATYVRSTVWSALGAGIAGVTGKSTPVDADLVGIADSAAANATKKTTFLEAWTNYFKAKADALYQPVHAILTSLSGLTIAAGDLIVGSGANAFTKLSKGSAGQVLKVNTAGTGLEWGVGAAPIDVQTFTASGTWTKPASGTMALIRAWGGGGGGARGSVGGAGGGGYKELWVPLSSLGATETVTVGAGGTGKTSPDGNGGNGGDSSFGSWLTAYGGGGGGTSSPASGGGLAGVVTTSNGVWDGGVGSTNASSRGGSSYMGGGGGSGSAGPTPGGASFAAGNGGGPGQAGSVPAGGGGSSTTTGGTGGRGQVEVYVF